MHSHSINILYNSDQVILWCLEVVPVENASEGSMQEHVWARVYPARESMTNHVVTGTQPSHWRHSSHDHRPDPRRLEHGTYNKHTNHMTMTTSGQIMSWTDYLKIKGNVNIKLPDLCETLIVYILLSTFQLIHMVLTVNKADVRRFIAWIESADWNPCITPILKNETKHTDNYRCIFNLYML